MNGLKTQETTGCTFCVVTLLFSCSFLPAGWRASLGVFHVSGHVLETVPDKQLVPYDLADDGFKVRVVHDWTDRVRVGATAHWMWHRSPQGQAMSFDQFAEWFPWGADGPNRVASASPYGAVGVEENG